jgi:pyridoxal 5'-phosphate synthase pdxT subunit
VVGAHPPIGVLDLQGDVREHVAALNDVGREGRLVKRPDDLEGIGGLVLPGGESTTLSMLLESTGLDQAIGARLGRDGGDRPVLPAPPAFPVLPVLGTCAGLVLLASSIEDGRPDQRCFGALNAVVRRNGYGRQVASFEGQVELGEGPSLPAVFIRAPLIVSVGEEVEVLGRFDGVPVLVRQGPILASVFHPELTPDRRVHRLFAGLCDEANPTEG